MKNTNQVYEYLSEYLYAISRKELDNKKIDDLTFSLVNIVNYIAYYLFDKNKFKEYEKFLTNLLKEKGLWINKSEKSKKPSKKIKCFYRNLFYEKKTSFK